MITSLLSDSRSTVRETGCKERMQALGLFVLLALLPLLGLSYPALAQPSSAPPLPISSEIISADEVRRGQKGHGFSVFAGTEPERFEVEVIGVLRNTTPDRNYILVRLSGHGLERTGVVAGMSGSPVYIEGRLAGAVSFGYSFGIDPIAGIMPIAAMRELQKLPPAAASAPRFPASTVAFDPRRLLQRELPEELLGEALERLRSPLVQGGHSAALWSASGFGEYTRGLLQQAVGPLASGGALALDARAGGSDGMIATEDLKPGSAIAGMLVQGDLTLAIHGTVTDRQGDDILAYGHPLFGSGPVSLPMSLGEVVTIIGNLANSFKVSNAGRVVGAFDQDRQAGVRGSVGLEAVTFPLAVEIRGAVEADYRMEITDIPELSPSLIGISALGAVNSSSYISGAQGLDLRAEIALADYEDLLIEQSFDGDQAVLQSVLYLLQLVQFLQQNELERVRIEEVELHYHQSLQPRTATLLAAHPARLRVRPGEKVPIALDLQPYRGPRVRRTVEYRVPENAAEGRLVVLLGDGTTMDAARLSILPRAPETMSQILAQLRSYHSRRELLFFALRPGAGLALGGEILPDLPPSMRSIYGSSGGEVGQPLALSLFGAQEQEMDQPIDGLLRIDFQVEHDPS